jgi:hypothetical protein
MLDVVELLLLDLRLVLLVVRNVVVVDRLVCVEVVHYFNVLILVSLGRLGLLKVLILTL